MHGVVAFLMFFLGQDILIEALVVARSTDTRVQQLISHQTHHMLLMLLSRERSKLCEECVCCCE